MATHIFTFTLSEPERDAVASSVPDSTPADERVQAYLSQQVASIVRQHVARVKREALKADGLPERLAEVGLDDDDVAAIKRARAVKIAAIEAAKVVVEDPVVEPL